MDCPRKTMVTIKRGDTLYRLAYTFKTTEEKILEMNPGLDAQYLQVGRIIQICPNTASMTPATLAAHPGTVMTAGRMELHDMFRELWEQHTMYTRMVINAVVDPEADDMAVTARLLRNPKDFAEVYRKYYGDTAAAEIDRLITEHLGVGKQLIAATVAGETEKAAALNAKWYQNADDWAAYLAKLSPNIHEAAMRKMLRSHLDLVLEQVAARIAKNYPANVEAYDRGEREVLEMADMMSNAILRQFPGRFK